MLRDQPFMRDDTFLGVCEALGEDFRFNPNLLRIALAPLLIWNPLVTAGAYVAAAVVIALLRWIVPNPRVQSEATAAPEAAPIPPAPARAAPARASIRIDPVPEELARAA